MFPEVSPPLLLLSSPPQILHPVVLPLTIAAYNLLSLLNIVPKIEVEKKIAHPHHHLRSATPLLPNLLPLSPSSHSADLFSHVDRYNDHKEHSSSSSSHQSSQTPSPSVVDLVSERRKAKALKVTSPNSLPALSHTPPPLSLELSPRQLLDAKMAELSQEPEGWDDKVFSYSLLISLLLT
jgi:hypothetical protein